jgi:hypothetical protein
MKKLIALIALSLFSITAFADPCSDADVSSTGLYTNQVDEDFYYSTDGC